MARHIGTTALGMLIFVAGAAHGISGPTIGTDGTPSLGRQSKSRVPDKDGTPPATDPKSDPDAAPGSPTSTENPDMKEKPKTDAAAGAPTITSLGESLDALRDRFNSNKGRYRFVTLLSPT